MVLDLGIIITVSVMGGITLVFICYCAYQMYTYEPPTYSPRLPALTINPGIVAAPAA